MITFLEGPCEFPKYGDNCTKDWFDNLPQSTNAISNLIGIFFCLITAATFPLVKDTFRVLQLRRQKAMAGKKIMGPNLEVSSFALSLTLLSGSGSSAIFAFTGLLVNTHWGTPMGKVNCVTLFVAVMSYFTVAGLAILIIRGILVFVAKIEPSGWISNRRLLEAYSLPEVAICLVLISFGMFEPGVDQIAIFRTGLVLNIGPVFLDGILVLMYFIPLKRKVKSTLGILKGRARQKVYSMYKRMVFVALFQVLTTFSSVFVFAVFGFSSLLHDPVTATIFAVWLWGGVFISFHLSTLYFLRNELRRSIRKRTVKSVEASSDQSLPSSLSIQETK